MNWNNAFSFEVEDWDINSEPINSDCLSTIEQVEYFLKDKTKNIKFLQIENTGRNLFILYFVECNNIMVKSMINYKLREMLESKLVLGLILHIKQVGHNFN